MRGRKIAFILAFCALIAANQAVKAQSDKPKWLEAGIEAQIYQSGFIFTGRTQVRMTSNGTFPLRVGYHIARWKDTGEHDFEEGEGPGFGFGYRNYFLRKHSGAFIEPRIDVWFLKVDWENYAGSTLIGTGTSSATTFQPTVAIGYQHEFNFPLALEIAVAFGLQINVVSSGEDVREGGIAAANLGVSYRF